SRGGVANAVFVHASVEALPVTLQQLATRLSVLLPWGSLLRAVVAPDPAVLAGLRAICCDRAELRVVFGIDAERDRKAGLPEPLEEHVFGALPAAYRAAGFAVRVQTLSPDAIARLPTTWAKKLAFGGGARRFYMIDGRVIDGQVIK